MSGARREDVDEDERSEGRSAEADGEEEDDETANSREANGAARDAADNVAGDDRRVAPRRSAGADTDEEAEGDRVEPHAEPMSRHAPINPTADSAPNPVVAEPIEVEGPAELFEFRLQICAHDAQGGLVAVHTKCERDETFPSRNTVKVANKQSYVLVFQVANTRVPFDSLLAVRVGEFDVPITKQLRSNNEFVCEGVWDTADIAPTGNGYRIQMPVRVAYLLGNEKYCRETEFILQMKVYDAKDAKKAQQGGTPLDCISCKFYRNSSRSVNYPTFLKT
ncbi:hypothetical protein KFE25_006405 [Diacronema lutheri]|uniref:CB1 cannabinoid receptor-interacting protein 1 n=1 Tax=Diacronema lutheri TaxID=2081491 RepID=A0A8J5XXY2_DIALT|nr:hypothetical protein KFE25_006405 [Diacronema lutheri]